MDQPPGRSQQRPGVYITSIAPGIHTCCFAVPGVLARKHEEARLGRTVVGTHSEIH